MISMFHHKINSNFDMKKYIQKISLFVIIVAILTSIDQTTKYLVTKYLKAGSKIIVINDILEIFYFENNGAAFGILKGKQSFFYIVTIVVFIFILYYIYKLPMTKKMFPLFLNISLLTSGALGNFIDRVRLQYVVDFIYFKPIDFPVFNIADSYITISCVIFIYLIVFYYKNEELLK